MHLNNLKAFYALIKAGLWEKDVRLEEFGEIDFGEIYRLAEEQSVVGLVAAGLEHVIDIKVQKEYALQFVGQALQLEKRNIAMNTFIAGVIEGMRKQGIYTLLMKGQGVAQCYERPLWRSSGDIDLLLSEDNYKKAVLFLTPLASNVEVEFKYNKHLAMNIDPWTVELHGNLRCGLSLRVDNVLDDVKKDIFYGGTVRSWMNNETQVFLPAINCDVVYIFTHILQHFYKGGIGLRQICDWSRLLWTYYDQIDKASLERRLKKMRLMTEWKAFGSFAVDYLGMDKERMPFYSENSKWNRKASRIGRFIIEVGNFGHNRVVCRNDHYIMRKIISFRQRFGDLIRHARVFPLNSFRFMFGITYNGLSAVLRGE